MRVFSAFRCASRPVLALALALAAGSFVASPAIAFDGVARPVGWGGYGYGPYHRPPPRVYVPPPRYIYVPPPRYIYVPAPPPVVYHRPPCWRLPPWHPAFCAPPPPRYHRHW
jgi:hypothetical protein